MRVRGADVLEGATCVVPVPLHASRRRQRGFNQAKDLARLLQLPVVPALRRIRATATQTDLPAAQRHRNVRGAFAVTRAAASLVGAIVVLVDDVSTDGRDARSLRAGAERGGSEGSARVDRRAGRRLSRRYRARRRSP